MRDFQGITEEQLWIVDVCKGIFIEGIDCQSVKIPTYIDWEKVFFEIRRHKLLPIFAYIARNSDWFDDLEYFYKNSFHDAILLNQYRSAFKLSAAKEIFETLAGDNIKLLFRKGFVFDEALYGGRGLRTYGDIDLFVREIDAGKVEAHLINMEFISGRYDKFRDHFSYTSRKEKLIHKLYPDHLPPLTKLTGDQLQPSIQVDICFNIEPNTALGTRFTNIIHRECFENDYLNQPTGFGESPAWFNFLDCALHLFREAYYQNSIVHNNGVSLSKFLDLVRIWQVCDDSSKNKICCLVQESGLRQQIGWSCHFSDAIFGSNLLYEVGIADAVHNSSLITWQTNHGETRTWSGNIHERLFSPFVLPDFATNTI